MGTSAPQIQGAALDGHGQGDDSAGARVVGLGSQTAAGGLRQGLGDDAQPLVDGALHLGVVPHDLREGQKPAALGLDGLSAGGEQDSKVLQEASRAVDKGLDNLGRRRLQTDDEEVGLGGEVVEDSAPGDSGESGDIIDRHRGVAALPGQGERGGADGGTGALRLGGAQVGSGHATILHSVQTCTQCKFARGSSRRSFTGHRGATRSATDHDVLDSVQIGYKGSPQFGRAERNRVIPRFSQRLCRASDSFVSVLDTVASCGAWAILRHSRRQRPR